MSSSLPARRAPLRPGLPFLGNALQANADPCRFFADGHRECGPVFRVRYPGQELVLLAGLGANALFAKDGGQLFDAGRTYARVVRELGTDRIPNAHDGPVHKELRGVLASAFALQALEPFVTPLLRRVESAARGWAPGAVHRASDVVEPLITELVAHCTTGGPAPVGLHRDLRRYGTLMGAVGVGAAGPEWMLYTPWVRGSRHRIAAFVEEALASHAARPAGDARTPDLIDALLAAGGRHPALAAPEARLALGMLPFKNAGIYLYRLVSFVLYELLRDPALAARATDEADAALAGPEVGLEALRAQRTLQGVILECLRLHPMAIALPRVVREPFVYEGYGFVPGDTVYIAGPVVHFLPEVFSDPDRFDPERFSPSRNEHRRAHAFAPFGLGHHACLARAWSQTLVSLAVGGILRGARLQLSPAGYRIRVRSFPDPIPEAAFRFAVDGPRTPASRAPAEATLEEGLQAALSEMPAEAQARVFADLRLDTFPAAHVIFHQGDEADRFHLLRKGEVEVVLGEAVVARLGPGAYFGEIGLLQGVPRTATVRTVTEVTTLTLGREAFVRLAVEADLTRAQLVSTMERRALLNQLARALPGLGAETLSAVGRSDGVRAETWPEGTLLVRQGEEADRFFVLVAGRVEVTNPHPSGAEVRVAELVAPDHFGEIGLLEARPRTANVRAIGGPVTVLVWSREAFTAWIGSGAARAGLADVATRRLLEVLGG